MIRKLTARSWNSKSGNKKVEFINELFSHINDNISRLELPLENLYRINESSIMDDSSKDMNIDDEVFPQTDVEFTNISVISEEMKKG